MKPKSRLDFGKATALTCALLLLAGACTRRDLQPSPAGQNRVLTAPTGASVAAEPEDGQWTMPAKNYASTRFSGLEDINTGNVANLKLAWSFSTGVVRGHEAAPIVANNTMYVITPYPNIVYALDLTQAGAPVKWKYESNPSSSAQGVACCDVVNRGVVYADGKIFFNTLDAQTIALDAATGTEVWKTRVGDINQGESMTM
ncbi:MAG TPA: PQQ-binding-like beta-propeller repeat protein, partial [Pyrinomonadaceae bacterium]|nr:PQQ-binding-like beta-propeller repeat protein [Pyrinomonadaceae bacterium]